MARPILNSGDGYNISDVRDASNWVDCDIFLRDHAMLGAT
jgi:hypothetical protein